MKGLLFILLLILAVVSCQSEHIEQSIRTELDSVNTAVMDQNTINEVVDKELMDHKKRKNNEVFSLIYLLLNWTKRCASKMVNYKNVNTLTVIREDYTARTVLVHQLQVL